MFPELVDITYPGHSESAPRHPSELITMLPELIGRTFVTVSEHLILMFLKEVRDGRIDPTELLIYYVDRMDFEHNHLPGRRIRVTRGGNLVDDWPGGFFRERAELLF
jgi:hypothetical protein